ncbi:MAG: phenylalanine--tRNA ligase subunit beta [Lutibacter sp.]|jgi:phenylalanyl-tRNA synthetase beta chain|nr:phenylalanine--tRNA ligase subunit beta [Lutibacter sp.]
MKISYNWLQQFLKVDWEADKTGTLLTDLGLEVEGIETVESVKGSLAGVVVGKVLTCSQHPNADRLKVTTVDIGAETPLSIVCGAPNVAAGQMVPVATIGTTLYDDKGTAFKIKKGKIRGEASHGMICAEDELGLGTSHEGIMVLDETLVPGTPAAEVFAIEVDQVFDIGLTPNRADAMSHLGTARELRAGLLQHDTTLELITPSVSNFHVDDRTLKIDIEVIDEERAPRYMGLTISEVVVKDSPDWIQQRLRAIGLTPLNNIVDITNYVLHELGQPLHAFDATSIKGNKVLVKTLPSGTKFTTLDGVERTLHEEDLMICNGQETPMCIAGVYGGMHSGITAGTTEIFLESAYFDPVAIRKTAKRHGLHTDASFRFERGIDPNITEYALKRAANLIVEIAGGKVASEIVDLYPTKIEDSQVFLSFERMDRLIGTEIPRETVKNILASLDIKLNSVTEGGLGLTVPSYRNDVTRQVDVIEEILRVYGYNNVEFSQKLNASIADSSEGDIKLENIVANQLVSQGFNEIMSNSLTKPAYASRSAAIDETQHVKMLNPLSNDLSVLRQSLLFGGLESVIYNINRKNNSLKFFEFGKSYRYIAQDYVEQKHLGLFVTGDRDTAHWNMKTRTTDFFYLKGVVTAIFSRLGIREVKTRPTVNDVFSEGISLCLGKHVLVELGAVKQSILKEFGIKQPVLFADFNWEQVGQLGGRSQILISPLAKFPAVKRDLALLVDQQVSFDDLYQLAFQTEKKHLKEVSLFDVYEGDKLPDGKKSYALSFLLQDKNKTLNDKQIDKIMVKFQQAFQKKVGATLRS